jgi:type II secretory pathway component PulC
MKAFVRTLLLCSVLAAPLASWAADTARGSAKGGASNAPEFHITPYLENGDVKGYTVSRFRSGSLVAKWGFREGDVIRRINGEPVTSPEKAVETYNLLRKNATMPMQVEILRGGKTKTLALNQAEATASAE